MKLNNVDTDILLLTFLKKLQNLFPISSPAGAGYLQVLQITKSPEYLVANKTVLAKKQQPSSQRLPFGLHEQQQQYPHTTTTTTAMTNVLVREPWKTTNFCHPPAAESRKKGKNVAWTRRQARKASSQRRLVVIKQQWPNSKKRGPLLFQLTDCKKLANSYARVGKAIDAFLQRKIAYTELLIHNKTTTPI